MRRSLLQLSECSCQFLAGYGTKIGFPLKLSLETVARVAGIPGENRGTVTKCLLSPLAVRNDKISEFYCGTTSGDTDVS